MERESSFKNPIHGGRGRGEVSVGSNSAFFEGELFAFLFGGKLAWPFFGRGCRAGGSFGGTDSAFFGGEFFAFVSGGSLSKLGLATSVSRTPCISVGVDAENHGG